MPHDDGTRPARLAMTRNGLRSLARGFVLRYRFGNVGRTEPLTSWGSGRGTPVDRWYIERYLHQNADVISGRVLEVKSDLYASALGASDVDVLDIDEANPQADIVGDLCASATLRAERYDAAIVTQTLQLVPDPAAAIRNLVASLRPGATLLLTVPSASRVAAPSDRWRWVPAGVRELLHAAVPADCSIDVQGFGNGLALRAFLFGLAAEDLDPRVLDISDADYPLIVAASVRRPVR